MEGAFTFEFDSAEQAMAMAGYQEEAIKRLSQQTGAKLVMRGTTLLISGTNSQVDRSKRLVTALESIWSQGQAVSIADVMTAVHALDTHREQDLSQLHGDVIARTRRGETVRAKTFRQRKYVSSLRTNDLIFCTGPAGTGKTFLAAMVAVQALLEQQYERLILTRPAVEAGERLGFLPGDLQQKVDPYFRPLYDALHELIDP